MWNKYKNVLIFLAITIMGIILYVYGEQGIAWKMYNMLGAATTVALSTLALMAYFEYAKGEDKIKIYFHDTSRKIYTKLYTQRKHFTRGEVLGLLRMIHCKQGNFEIADFNKNPGILKRFEAIQNAESDELVIEITKEELKQFNVL